MTVPEDVMPVAAAIAPEELTWKRSPDPTVKSADGSVSPIPMFPLARIVILVTLLVSTPRLKLSLVPIVTLAPNELPPVMKALVGSSSWLTLPQEMLPEPSVVKNWLLEPPVMVLSTPV